LLAIAGAASAELVTDGGFEGTNGSVQVRSTLHSSYTDRWYQNNAGHWSHNTTDDRMDRVAGSSTGSRAIGQIMTLATGEATSGYTLDIAMYLDDGDDDSDLYVSLWGVNIGTAGGHLVSLAGSTTDPVDDAPAGYTYESLVDWTSSNGGDQDYLGANSLKWTGLDLTGFDQVMLRIGASSVDAGETMYVDTVSLAVPEPATVGMLGLGSIVALLIRRIRA